MDDSWKTLPLNKRRELLDKFKLLEKHSSLKDTQGLEKLTSKWKEACKAAFADLYTLAKDKNPDQKLSMPDLARHLGIDKDILDIEDSDEE
ncbi:hypothetical protein QYM36_011360 [Artemia franciscana]|uniref:Swi5-dependent recombination DNA repair protein 1 homolog n=1 Tax=Artemia franciscana TaxID=6661 RepID=A0AA88HJZ9_ARTSF|nr:hypothetical protein QYM36_011360 [Artemia franciscana]